MSPEPPISPVARLSLPSWAQCIALLESAPMAIIYADCSAKIYANPRYYQILGLSPEEVNAGKDGFTHLHPDDVERVRHEWQDAVLREVSFVSEYRVEHRDGRVEWVQGRVDPICDADGKLTHWSGVLIEITDRKRAEEALNDNQARLQLLIKQVPGSLWTTDTDLRFTSTTEYPRDNPMYKGDALLGKTVASIMTGLPAEVAERYLAPHASALKGQSGTSEGAFGGFYFQSRVDPLRDASGRIIGAIGLAIDISERRRTEEQLRISQARLELIFAQLPAVLWTTDCDLRVTSSSGTKLIAPRISFDDPSATRTLYEILQGTGELEPRALEAHHKALAGESASYEAMFREAWFQATVHPLRSADGTIVGTIALALDTTARFKAERALREAHDLLEQRVAERTRDLSQANLDLERKAVEHATLLETLSASEQRYAGMLNAQQTLVARAGMDLRVVYQNAAYEQALRLNRGQRVTDSMHPDDRAATVAALDSLMDPPHVVDFENRRLINGGWRWVHWQYSVIRDRAGSICEYQAVGFDVHERHIAEELLRESREHYREAAEANRRLLQELDHRVRNNIAGLLSLASATRTRSKSVEEFAKAMHSRLLAMSHSHNLLASTSWRPVQLTALLTSLLGAARSMACAEANESMRGPEVQVPPAKTPALAMIIFEWLTNSCKYGAHSLAGGHLSILWAVEHRADKEWLHLQWTERDGPPVAPEWKPSMGTELIRGFATRELGGRVDLAFPTEGANHVLEFPLS